MNAYLRSPGTAKRTIFIPSRAVVMLAVLSGSAALVQTAKSAAEFQGLGSHTRAGALSANGRAVSGVSETEGFRWTTTGGMQTLPTFNTYNLDGISANGAVVAGTYTQAAGSTLIFGAYRWSPGNSPEYCPLYISFAHGLSSDGTTVIGFGGNNYASIRPYAWFRGAIHFLAGDAFSEPVAASANAAVIVGTHTDAQGNTVAGRWGWWSGGSYLVSLGDLAGGETYSVANAVSSDGSIAVGFGHGTSGKQAVRWIGTSSVQSLGQPFFGHSSVANAVSPDGSVVVGQAVLASLIGGGSSSEPVIWDYAHGMRWLRNVLESYGLSAAMSGWHLEDAVGVVSDTRYLYFAGNGINPSGQNEAWWARVSQPLK
jgi:uncharacterized membrane protein